MFIPRPPFTLRQLLGGLYALSLLTVTLGVLLLLHHQLSAHFYNELVHNGRTIAEQLAEDSRWAVIQGTAENIQPRLDTLATYPNVVGIVIATAQDQVLATWGPQPVRPATVLAAEASARITGLLERDPAITLIAPVPGSPAPETARATTPFGEPILPSQTALAPAVDHRAASPEPLGYVALTLSKAPIRAHLQRLQEQVLLVMAAGGFTMTVLMGYALRHITHPIHRLARVMADPETVQSFAPVPVAGVHEAQVIARAFNALMAQVAATHQALTASNAALTASQASLAQQVAEAVKEVRQQNAALVIAREQAVAASRVKSEFMANMSHEIRTPLHGVIGFITVLAKTPLDATQKSYLHLLKNAAHSLLAVINSILDFSKLEAGKTVLQRQPFRLRELVENTVHLFAPNADAKGLRLHVTVDPHLPAIVCGDPQRLAQIMRNLVDNALKFTTHGQVCVQIQALDLGAQSVTCRLQVEDTGMGIPETHQASIFSAFNQVDASTTRQQGGTGLGLAICQQLTALMQGRLGVQSAAGQGSTFWVDLPLPLATAAAAPSADRPEPNRDPDPGLDPTASDDTPISARRLSRKDQGEPARVLVVDDHETNRAYAKIALARFHADVVLVENGQAALEACQHQHFDLILMDIRMPGLDGLETTRRIRRWCQNPNGHTPILGLTADVLNTHRQNWQAAGMNDCLFKPLGEEALTAALAPWGISPAPETATITPDAGETPA